MSALSTGAELGPNTFTITRADLVRYAGASGDFNPIHWNDRIATMVGLPGVIAHGMFTMALVASAVDEWAGAGRTVRSEERRVGKECVSKCRSRWSPYP